MGLKTLRLVIVKPILLDLTELILLWKQPQSSGPSKKEQCIARLNLDHVRRDSKTESFPPFLFFYSCCIMVVGRNALPCYIPMFILTQSCIFRQTFLRAKRAQD